MYTIANEYWLDQYPELIHSRFNKIIFLEALKLVPKNNNFIVKDEHFHQFLGTAMGIIVASTYATLCNTSHGIPRNSVLRKK